MDVILYQLADAPTASKANVIKNARTGVESLLLAGIAVALSD